MWPTGKADKKLVERWVNSRLGFNTGFCRLCQEPVVDLDRAVAAVALRVSC